jgi:hypothetical protein
MNFFCTYDKQFKTATDFKHMLQYLSKEAASTHVCQIINYF